MKKQTTLPVAIVFRGTRGAGKGVAIGHVLRRLMRRAPGSGLVDAEPTTPPTDKA
jgi:hypothetical protein